MAKRALIVGINHYDTAKQLSGAIPDAQRVSELLCRHSNGDLNYECMTLTSADQRITQPLLRSSLQALFQDTNDQMLFYFSGHGTITPSGGFIVSQDATTNGEGISMDELLSLANRSGRQDAVIILDCCFSGGAGSPSVLNQAGTYQQSILSQNVTILAASRHNEPSMEVDDQGVFTELLIDALEGAAADMLGNITLPAIYAHIAGALGPWDQRPIYKTHTEIVNVLRKADPRIELPALRRLTTLFPVPDFVFPLAPEYEYDEYPETEKQKSGHLFKRYRDAGLITTLKPGQDLYWAAKYGDSIELTRLGRHYWRLITAGRV